ncbi:MAG: D-glycero-beta-D-manno-heptose-1,7-bisphosphate 7-phosphatase [Zetaproteobacteria bacterium CG12_big_fil_rev_8_21_14_0_65_54_13]|nr:MAG: D-glycero-beta-D-manno-heptose-1,7-bisphosphate 7-phosphatase [Zetaproteobacteria bacterium CG12_big_fil_rev_8_21_14_0_65_54_13]PIX54167.1 MAG: D-glycero-beta-D-manno-heptose-1,7-bisphosphate 7-phosphatase [Zetaproteobacteria bacterium CG_4_10_14_3_um_filter_54_28]PJA29812.1 MAG: D-glycero-beta-D-manno-heptose-1,7-bisphosphate 7-phosphatase [Zetaproteobacteria bacterium CG_4_9_14_3_um_filter_54_145]
MMPKAVLLDRDGVINFDSPDYILAPDQWLPVPGSLAAIARLHAAGIAVAIVSNQSGLGRGMMDQHAFNAIHGKMMLAIEQAGGFISHVAYCPHGPDDHCHCRKPKPGMVLDSLAALGLSDKPENVLFIGDSIRDVEAASAAHVPAMLVQSGYGDSEKILQQSRLLQPDIACCADLAAAVNMILGDQC